MMLVGEPRLQVDALGRSPLARSLCAFHSTSPPATAMACPVIASLPGRHSHSTALATSSGRTRRCCGLRRDQRGARFVRRFAGLAHDVGDRGADHLGIGVARADRVDRDVAARHLQRQRARQSDDAVLGRAVRGDVGVADQARPCWRCSRRARSRAPACRGSPPARTDSAGEIDVEHLLPQRQCRCGRNGALAARPALLIRICDRAELLLGARERAPHRLRVGHVDRRRAAPARCAQLAAWASSASRLAAHQRERRALLRERRGDRRADAAAAARHDGVSCPRRLLADWPRVLDGHLRSALQIALELRLAGEILLRATPCRV